MRCPDCRRARFEGKLCPAHERTVARLHRWAGWLLRGYAAVFVGLAILFLVLLLS